MEREGKGDPVSVRKMDCPSYYRSDSWSRIPYFFSFSNSVDFAIPSSRAVRVLFHFCRESSVRILVFSDCSHRERDRSDGDPW